jgi:hypothetical protein
LTNFLYRRVIARKNYQDGAYIAVASDEEVPLTATTNSEDDAKQKGLSIPKQSPNPQLPFHRIWTSNVILTMLSQAFFDFHLGSVYFRLALLSHNVLYQAKP